jgi:RHS repeat-associated protein
MKIGIDNGGNWTAEYYEATVVSVIDYYPFGSAMAGRKFNDNSYRFGFNGQEEDPEWKGGAVVFKYRIHDARIGKFLSVDPLASEYPWNSTYAFAENRVIDGIDLEGREWDYYMIDKDDGSTQIVITVKVDFNYSTNIPNVAEYKEAMQNQFKRTLEISSNNEVTGVLIFNEGFTTSQQVVPTLTIYDKGNSEGDSYISGGTTNGSTVQPIKNKYGDTYSPEYLALTYIHELFHTVRLHHPFELTQGDDLLLTKDNIDGDCYESSLLTDENIFYNIMNYPMISIDGLKLEELWEEKKPEYLTSDQIDLILKEIDMQKDGQGLFQYNSDLTPEKNTNLYSDFVDYWAEPFNNGEPVKRSEN